MPQDGLEYMVMNRGAYLKRLALWACCVENYRTGTAVILKWLAYNGQHF